VNGGTGGWDRHNEEYLAAALAWLRLRLRRAADRRLPTVDQAGPVVASTQLALTNQPSRRWSRGTRPADGPPAGAPGLTAPQEEILVPGGADEQALAKVAAALADAADTTPPPALVLLASRFGLADYERELLLLCVGIELDPSLAALCAAVQGDRSATYPTFALAFEVFDNPSWQPLLPDRPLRHFGLIEVFQPAGTPLTASALRADERVVSYAKGASYVDDRLAPLLISLEAPDMPAPPPSVLATVDRLVAELAGSPTGTPLPVVQLLGPDSATKQLAAALVSQTVGLHLFQLPAELLPADPGELERLARLWQRETILMPVALYLDAADAGLDAPAGHVAASRFLDRGSGMVFVDVRVALPRYRRAGLVVDLGRPTAAEQADVWRAALGAGAGDAPERLAAQFDLGAPTIAQIAGVAGAAPDDRPLADRAWAACLMETRKGLDALAQRIDTKATWDDIVLPDTELALLRTITDQVAARSAVYDAGGFAARTARGLGINALFAGPSGTGKTLAAEVIASHLRLNLFRIDLSAVVSKYIGETEKNLARLFREAESGGVVLFFDEADALFGKRTEIRDSHDRYANIEINYLLQRMESYRGLAILATNMKSALDAAFVRRLRFVVTFAYPAQAERRRIWERVFPPETRTAALDHDRLARFNFTGGNIFTVALNAAFLAARDGAPVTMQHIMQAARMETRKLERSIDEREFLLPEQVMSR
jgi:ATPase family associated with various cellular activities (AAA)